MSRLRELLAPLPVRFDDRRLWLRAAIGLALRAVALELAWAPLRAAFAWGVLRSLALVGIAAEAARPGALAVGPTTFDITVRCTQIEVFALVVPLLWDRSLGTGRNLGRIAGLGLAMYALGVVRIDLSIALYLAGVPWAWAHDVCLGVCYFAVLAATLALGAWTGAPATPWRARAIRARPGSSRA
ncbi:MAG: hypothetical protein HY908_20075 [Myxococcales bacterium]|nr:hypothetical protein [Myxococcales bacterium]